MIIVALKVMIQTANNTHVLLIIGIYMQNDHIEHILLETPYDSGYLYNIIIVLAMAHLLVQVRRSCKVPIHQ